MSSVCLSVCLSVTLVDCDHIGWKSRKLIARTISPIPSLFVAQRPSQGNMGKFWGRLEVGWEKVACWSTKAAISLKHVKIEEKLLWGAYRNSQRSSERYHLDLLQLHLPKIRGSQPPPKTPIAIISGTGSYGLQIWPTHAQGPSEQTPIKNFGEKGAWAYPGTAQIFQVSPPPIISGTGKTMNFKFCTHNNYWLNRNKSPLQISGKVAVGVVRDSRKFTGHGGHPYIGRIARSSLQQLSFLV